MKGLVSHIPFSSHTNTSVKLVLFIDMFRFVFSLDGYSPEYGVTFYTTIIDKFSVSFGREGETMSLGCTVIVYPNVKRYQPEIVWSRNGGCSNCKPPSSAIVLEICIVVKDLINNKQSSIQSFDDDFTNSSGVALSPSKWVTMHWSGERATLTLVHLNKEDEGLYTLRVNTKSGFDTHSAYVFVRGQSYQYILQRQL